MKMKQIHLTMSQVEDLSMSHFEPGWVLQRRQLMAEQLDTLGMPKIERAKIHRWDAFQGTLAPCTEIDDRVFSFATNDKHALLVQQEDQTTVEQLAVEDQEKGIVVTDLETAISDYPQLMMKYFLNQAPKNLVEAYHNAVTTSGAVIYIPKGVQVEQPIELHFFQSSQSDRFFSKQVIVIAEENSSVEVTAYHQPLDQTKGQARSFSVQTTIFAKSGACVQYTAFDEYGEAMTGFIERKAYVARDAHVDWTIAAMNHGKAAYHVYTELNESGATSDSRMMAISDGVSEQVVEINTQNKSAHTIGHILQHGIVQDKGQVIFNGIGKIHQGANGAEAIQKSRILMMSEHGRGDANPILLIEHDDVKANHAASIGQLNEEDIYYLMSRGLTQHMAERIVARGFLEPVVQSANQDIQDELWSMINRKLA